MQRSLLMLIACFLFYSNAAFTQTENTKIFNPTIKWQFILQNRFESSLTDSVDVQNKFNADPVNNNFRIRRAAIKTDLLLSEKITGTIRLQLPELKTSTPGKTIELAYANFKLKDGFQIRAGQFLVPFVLDELTPYDNLRMIDRGPTSILFVNSYLASYQPGVMIFGNLLKDKTPLNYYLAAVNASDRSVGYDDNSSKNILGRIEFTPIKGVRLAVTDQVIGLKDETGNSYSADISIQEKINSKVSLLIEGEYLNGTNVLSYNADTTAAKKIEDFNMGGYEAQALLKFDLNKKWCKLLEVGGKFENTDPLSSIDENEFSTITGNIAFNFLPDNNARLQLNFIHTDWKKPISGSDAIDAANMFVAQLQLKI
ncbi:MAG: hypothetical protein H7Y00_02975 [Fimbriimonadaceae bacterium]|nr:hypothetical protein [Chitinophagales bacterium]